MSNEIRDLYTDFLIASMNQTTATGLSDLTDGVYSHDQITYFLRKQEFTSKDIWLEAKPIVRKIESSEGVLLFDDSIEEKPHTDENDIICWHWDHSKNRSVKGINFLSALYYNNDISLPVGVETIQKKEKYVDKKTGKQKRRSEKSKNEIFREILCNSVKNQIQFTYVLADIWFASSENMKYIKTDMKKEFIMPLKSNRKVALSLNDKQKGKWVKLESLETEQNTPTEIYIEGVDFPLQYIKQVFINGNGSTGTLHLVSSDIDLSFDSMTTIYQKRWKIEEYHKSLKQNASLAKSPTKTVRTQTNHFLLSIFAFLKLERLKITMKKNHFAMKAQIYFKSLQSAYLELQELRTNFENIPVV